MQVFYFNIPRLTKNLIALCVIGITVYIFTMIVQQSLPILAGTSGKVVNKVHTTEKATALTFNVLPESDPLPVLNMLEKHHIKAAFFVSPYWADNNRQALKKMSLKGHEVNIFLDSSAAKNASLVQYMEEGKAVFKKQTGYNPSLVRLENPAENSSLSGDIYGMGFQVVGSTATGEDWLQPGSIISVDLNDNTSLPAELENKIKKIKESKYEMLTVSELLSLGPGISE